MNVLTFDIDEIEARALSARAPCIVTPEEFDFIHRELERMRSAEAYKSRLETIAALIERGAA